MEGDEHRRRQYEQADIPREYVHEFGTPGANVLNLRGASGGDGPDQLRQSQQFTSQPPRSAPLSAITESPQDLGSYGYVQAQQYHTPQMHGHSFPYQPDCTQGSQRQRQFSPYNTTPSIYTAPQQAAQPTQSLYDPMNQYHPRQSATQVISSQFGTPQYFTQGQSTDVSGPAVIPQQYQTAAYPQTMQFASANLPGRSNLATSYSTIIPEFSQNAGATASEQPEDESDTYERAYDRYQRALRVTNDHTSKGRLIEAGQSLLDISRWLSNNVITLSECLGVAPKSVLMISGLSRDDQEKHSEQIRFWDNFNTCWLAMLQRQKDATHQTLVSGQAPAHTYSILPKGSLEEMGNELVALCDGLEKFGLVDYQMGVSEEEIVESKFVSARSGAGTQRFATTNGCAVLNQCLDLLSIDDDESDCGAEKA